MDGKRIYKHTAAPQNDMVHTLVQFFFFVINKTRMIRGTRNQTTFDSEPILLISLVLHDLVNANLTKILREMYFSMSFPFGFTL